MNNKLFLLSTTCVCLLILASCYNSTSTSLISQNPSDETSAQPSESSTSISVDDSISDSVEDSTSDSIVLPTAISLISEVNSIANLLPNTNDVGIANGDELVKIRVRIVADLDSVTTQGNYGSERYKMLAIDTSGSLYVRMASADREALQKYVSTSSSFGSTLDIIGYPSLYREENELLFYSYGVSPVQVDVNFQSIATSMSSISSIYSEIGEMKMNNKGRAFSEVISFDAYCLHKLATDDNNLIFIDNNNSILAYDQKNLYNGISEGVTYKIYASLEMMSFRPSVVLLQIESSSRQDISFSNFEIGGLGTSFTGAQLYAKAPGKDYDPTAYPTNSNYSDLFGKMYRYEGYINYYLKNETAYMVLEDSAHSTGYSAYTNAANAKALFVNNHSEEALYSNSDFNNSVLYQALIANPSKKYSVYVFPYFWNTNNYFQVELLLNSLS